MSDFFPLNFLKLHYKTHYVRRTQNYVRFFNTNIDFNLKD